MLTSTVADQQIVAATSATLAWQPIDSEGEPADPGIVTVGVTRSDGTVLIAAGNATSGALLVARTVTVTAAQTAVVDLLTATWSVGATVVARTVHEVIGRPLITRAEFAAVEPGSATMGQVAFQAARREVDAMFTRVCRRSFVPRFAVERIYSRYSGVITLRFPDVREVRWAQSTTSDGMTTTIDISNTYSDSADLIRRSSTSGQVEIGYVHGMDRTPFDVKRAAAKMIRYVSTVNGQGSVPARATSYSDGQGGTTQLATPGLGPFITGVPEVDEILVDYRWDVRIA